MGVEEEEGERERAVKRGGNRWRSAAPSLKRILIKVPEIDTQNKQPLWEPDLAGIALPPRGAGCSLAGSSPVIREWEIAPHQSQPGRNVTNAIHL